MCCVMLHNNIIIMADECSSVGSAMCLYFAPLLQLYNIVACITWPQKQSITNNLIVS